MVNVRPKSIFPSMNLKELEIDLVLQANFSCVQRIDIDWMWDIWQQLFIEMV